jgi:hypothetical protein
MKSKPSPAPPIAAAPPTSILKKGLFPSYYDSVMICDLFVDCSLVVIVHSFDVGALVSLFLLLFAGEWGVSFNHESHLVLAVCGTELHVSNEFGIWDLQIGLCISSWISSSRRGDIRVIFTSFHPGRQNRPPGTSGLLPHGRFWSICRPPHYPSDSTMVDR